MPQVVALTSILVIIACIALLFIVLAIYPGRWVGYAALHARLYDSAAETYEEKWLRHDYSSYDELLCRSCSLVARLKKNDYHLILRGYGSRREVIVCLPTDTQFVCVDVSPAMLRALETTWPKPRSNQNKLRLLRQRGAVAKPD